MQHQRQRHRPACQQDVILDESGAAVIAGGAAAGVADRHRDAQQVRDRIVVAVDGDEAPDAEHGGVEPGADRVTRLPLPWPARASASDVRRSYLRIWKARMVPITTISTRNGHSSSLPVFIAVMMAAMPAQTEPNEGRPEILAHGNRPAPRKASARALPGSFAFSDRPTALERARTSFLGPYFYLPQMKSF